MAIALCALTPSAARVCNHRTTNFLAVFRRPIVGDVVPVSRSGPFDATIAIIAFADIAKKGVRP